MPRSTSERNNCQARLRCAVLAAAGSWLSRISQRMASQPSVGRLSTFSSMPCVTWKRDTSGSGGAVVSLVKVAWSQST